MPLVDQRGFSRVVGGTTDIGSYEVQPYTVTNANDSGRGSLHQAVLDDISGDEPITFAASLAGKTITLLSPIQINHNVTITGPAASSLTISGGGATEIFQIVSGTVSISGVTLAGGFAPQGGAISNSGTLSVSAVIFIGDVAQSTAASPNALGGAIYNGAGAVLNVINSTFNNDSAIATAGALAAGGAIENQGGTITLTGDTFTANLAEGGTSGSGGAIDNASTFNPGGSVKQTGMANIVNVTISANTLLAAGGKLPTPPGNGAGVENEIGATLFLESSIVANDVFGPDVVNLGTVTGDSNMIPLSTGLPAGVVGSTANPMLGPLQYNGGPTPTMVPAGQSAALDNGNGLYVNTSTDQTGTPRIIGGQVDVGSVEYGGPIYVLNSNDSGDDSLRSAIETAALYPNSKVVFDPSLAGRTITLLSEILLTSNVVIDGSGVPGLIISGGGTNRAFEVAAGVSVTLKDITIEDGSADNGGAVLNSGTLTLDAAILAENTASARRRCRRERRHAHGRRHHDQR